jgi:hypothetical protein
VDLRRSGKAAFVVVGLLLLGSASEAVGAPPSVATQISIGAANGYRAVAETALANGAVVDTFQSSAATVRVIGRPGSSVSFSGDQLTSNGGTVSLSFATTRPKTASELSAYAASGRSAVKDLIALGMPADKALAEFGDMDTPDGSPSPLDDDVRAAVGQSASARLDVERVAVRPAVTVSTTTPYDTQCASVSTGSGYIQGYGCTTFYLVYANGSDWRFTDKFKFSAYSTDTSLLPKRLKQVGWGVHWSTNNVITDWDPAATIAISSSCKTVTVSSTGGYASISISGTICPDSLGPTGTTSVESGAVWKGNEHDTDTEAAIGTQEVHSPSTASASYNSTYLLQWSCGGVC